MATPTYNTAPRGQAGSHYRPGTPSGAGGSNRWFGGHMPQYHGPGQPGLDSGGSIFGTGTPAYMSAPAPAAPTHGEMTSTPQADAPAIVVPHY